MTKVRIGIGAAVALVVAVVAAVTVASLNARGKPKDAGAPSVPNVTLFVARPGAVDERIEAAGRVGPPAGSSAKIAFAQAGILQAVAVRVGDRVSAGESLAVLDRAALGAAVQQARADARGAAAGFGGGAVPSAAARSAAARLAVANGKLQTLQSGGPAALSSQIEAASTARQAALKVQADEAAIARNEQLLAAGVVATKDVDAARAQLASDEADQRTADAKVAAATSDFQAAIKAEQADVATARSDVQTAQSQRGILGGAAGSAQARLASAQIAFQNGVLHAPADGIVLAILKHPGESVDATQPVMEVGPLFGNSVTLTVPADASRRIARGDPVTLQLTQRTRVTHGSVIAVVPAVDPTTQAGTVVVSGAPADAVPGDAVNATIVVGRAAGVVVPTSAIVQDPQTGKTVVFVRTADPKSGNQGFAMRSVSVRAGDATTTSLAAGLRPGERVAAQGGYTLLAPAGG